MKGGNEAVCNFDQWVSLIWPFPNYELLRGQKCHWRNVRVIKDTSKQFWVDSVITWTYMVYPIYRFVHEIRIRVSCAGRIAAAAKVLKVRYSTLFHSLFTDIPQISCSHYELLSTLFILSRSMNRDVENSIWLLRNGSCVCLVNSSTSLRIFIHFPYVCIKISPIKYLWSHPRLSYPDFMIFCVFVLF